MTRGVRALIFAYSVPSASRLLLHTIEQGFSNFFVLRPHFKNEFSMRPHWFTAESQDVSDTCKRPISNLKWHFCL